MAEVITFGEAMVVFISEETGEFKDVSDFTKGLAGAELNVAVGITRLGHNVKYITRLGTDPYGDYIFDFIKKEGIDTSGVIFDRDHLTGSYIKSKVHQGDPQVFYYRKNSAASCVSRKDIDQVEFEGAGVLHLSGITAAISESCLDACYYALEKARQCGMKVVFDPNIRRRLWNSEEEMISTLNDLAGKCDVVLPGIEEGRVLAGTKDEKEIARFYLSLGAKTVVVKLGASGAFYQEYTGRNGYVKGFKVDNVVDTVGAGDAFASGFISGILEGMPVEDAVVRGNAMGAIIITSKTDNEILPTKEELEKYLQEHLMLG
ncbi:sugar kinase [Eubacterium sp. am_0171]|nr:MULTISPECIES: sugar kinase [unclassified Eubacterium (in: firmicutes)]MSC83612.1 sugar kinase [Eubacterium sp. BIOML-A1]MSD04677.1 sugar kinase [Eubacterium sp. BIOML-A2]RYT25853.1 sugar kinase [Eubacterium sp. am_0171]